MNVLLISEYFPPHWTGIAKAFYHIAQNLKSQGHKVSVITTQFDKSLKRSEIVLGIRIIRVPYIFQLSRSHFAPQTIFSLINHLADFDAVVINSPHSLILPISILTKLFGKKLYIFHQGDLTLPRQTGNQLLNRTLELLFDSMTIPALALANTVSCSTADYAQNSRVLKYFLHKFTAYIPDLKLSSIKPTGSFVKKMQLLKKKYLLVGIAGRFVEEKGFDLLFQSIPQILKAVPNIQIVFAGEMRMAYEPFFEKHQKLIEKNKNYTSFLGLLNDEELSYFYHSLDLFVISSRSDCFPLSQIEAAQAGVPIVCTDIPGARMLVKSVENGIIVKSNSPHDLGAGIINFIKRKDKLKIDKYKIDRYFKKYETFRLD